MPSRLALRGLGCLLAASITLGLSSAASANGIILRGETLIQGATAPTLSLPDGRILDLRRLIEGDTARPPFDSRALLIHDLDRQTTKLADSGTATRSLVSTDGSGTTYLGGLLDQPGDLVYYETSGATPKTIEYAERFTHADPLSGQRLYLSNPAILVPEPSTTALLIPGVAALIGLARQRRAL